MMERQRQRGFTLIEALVAVAVLSIAATAAIQVFAAGAKLSSARAERYRIFHDAEMRLSLMQAEVLASTAPVARESIVNGYLIRERAVTTGAIDVMGAPTLVEISVSVLTTGTPERNVVTLTDYMIRDGQ